MKQISAQKFGKRCLRIVEQLGPEGIIITNRGKPVAKLLPISSAPGALIGSMRGKVKFAGDVFSTGARWDAGF
jgi:antitoxin (DNA-binding transcriptional repressor) of toxin-antitoxin stability system